MTSRRGSGGYELAVIKEVKQPRLRAVMNQVTKDDSSTLVNKLFPYMAVLVGISAGKNRLEDLDIEGYVMLKRILKK